MTTNKPEPVAFYHANKTNPGIRGVTLSHDPSWANVYESTEPLIRLSDYEALQAEFVIRLDELSARNYELRMGLAEKTSECEQLRKDSERLDWIESQAKKSPTGISFDYHKYVEDGYVLEHGFRFMRRHFASGFKDNIRKAIDAAMQEGEQ